MGDFKSIADIRREYGKTDFNEKSANKDPIAQFQLWFDELLTYDLPDPTAMVLSTVDAKGRPDSRVVLLKGLDKDNFIFYTNYESAKSKQLQTTSFAALNFYWPQMTKQIRVRGEVKKISKEQSDAYFASRPVTSQFSAIVSPQSQEIANRTFLEDALDDLIQRQGENPIIRPDHWGGYMVIPFEIEFWQGRENRLHDRIKYFRQGNEWKLKRLAP